ncbi:MAG: sulfotransferase [Pirellulaceae bacterium]|nr:sulfotransferase [Pirellulaceae bacterium]
MRDFSGGIIRRLVPREMRGEDLQQGVSNLESMGTDEDYEMVCSSPVFLLSAGWRSGSTLLQRLICSDRQRLMWGEPFGDRIPICRLASTISGITKDDPHLKYSIQNMSGDLSQQWIANLNPGISTLRQTHMEFVEGLLGKPAKGLGFNEWGAKWVRLSAHHATYLRWLYPDSIFVFLVRNPLDAYASYKGKDWCAVYPHHQVRNAWSFFAIWAYLANTFLNHQLDSRSVLLKYEDVTAGGQAIEKLEAVIGMKIDSRVLSRRVGASGKTKVSWYERRVCKIVAGDVSRRLGYSV